MKHFKQALILAAIGCIALAGCGNQSDTTSTEVSETTEIAATEEVTADVSVATESSETEVSTNLQTGRNPLTGEPMDEALASQRPVAVMIGNTTDALPQYGTSAADIIYEATVEGGITRIMGIYQDYQSIETIMSVRSCRHYFAYFAEDFNAIYCHYGQAVYATEMLEGIDDLNGLDGDLANVTFFRDSSRKAPHNAYVTGESLVAGIEKRGYDTQLSSDYTGHFKFAADGETITLDDGEDAVVVKPGYVIDKPWFVYNEDDGLYYRYQFKAEHVDATTGEQLAFKNILFLVAQYSVFPDGKYLDIKHLSAQYQGWYMTNGKVIEIRWDKPEEDQVAKYYDMDGNEIVLNQGKTYVCNILDDAVDKVGFYASEEEFQAAQ
ncbi:MAG: DUF3048 domain-containing protein [Lachnospiraceae bacterium]